MPEGACEGFLCRNVQAARPMYTYISLILCFLCSHTLSVFSSTKCVHFLRAISSAEEFSPLPLASSTTGGPIILIPYRHGEGEEWEGGLQGLSKAPHYLYILLPPPELWFLWLKAGVKSICLLIHLEILVLPECSALNHWIVALRERRARSKMLFDHYLSAYFIKV